MVRTEPEPLGRWISTGTMPLFFAYPRLFSVPAGWQSRNHKQSWQIHKNHQLLWHTFAGFTSARACISPAVAPSRAPAEKKSDVVPAPTFLSWAPSQGPWCHETGPVVYSTGGEAQVIPGQQSRTRKEPSISAQWPDQKMEPGFLR